MTTDELAGKVREFKELQAFIRQIEDEADAVRAALIAELEVRRVDTLAIDIYTVKYTPYHSTRMDTTRFKAEHGDLYTAYCKTTEARRFSIA